MAQVLSSPGVKPQQWRARPARLGDDWRWAWRDVRGHTLMWEGGGDPGVYGVSRIVERLALNTGHSWVVGPEGVALDFDGTSGVGLQTTATYDWTQPFTVLGLMSFDDLTADRGMSAANGGSLWQWQCWMDTGNSNFAIATRSGGGSIQVADGGSPNTTDRFLLGISFDGVDQWNLWVDGANLGTITEGSVQTGTHELNIGVANVFDTSKPHDGRFSVHYHWGKELPASRHRQLARDPFGPFRMARTRPAFVAAQAVSNARMADLAFCRGTVPFGVGRLPIPDGTID